MADLIYNKAESFSILCTWNLGWRSQLILN